MEIILGDVKLTAEEAPRPIGRPHDTYIHIEVVGDFCCPAKRRPKVSALELKAAIEALEKSCWRI